MKKIWQSCLACVAWVLAAAAPAQPTLRNDTAQAEDTIRGWIVREFAQRSPQGKATEDPLRDVKWHFVFLVNTTNFARRSAYAQFVQSTIQRFLTRQAALSEGDAKDRLSIYTYQLALSDARPSLKERALDGTAIELFRREFPSVPDSGLAVGHDNAGARRALLERLGDPDQDRPTVVIQFTDIAINEAPRDRALDRRIRATNGQTGAMEGLPWVAYETPGQPFSAFDGAATYDVHAWLYGPARFDRAQLSAPRPQPTEATPEAAEGTPPAETKEEQPAGSYWPLIGWVLAALAALAGLLLGAKALLRGRTYRVTVGSGLPITLTKGESRRVCGPNAKEPGAIITLPDANAPPAALFRLKSVASGVQYEPLVGEVRVMPEPPGRVMTPGQYDLFIKYESYSRTLHIVVESVEGKR
ncbi:MAG: hypothetical protein ACK41F_04375 [Fimbriimonadaceae bacterium]